jgi:hypothetical protein
MGPLPAVQTISKHDDKVRMLVLETDAVHPDTHKEIGSFGEVFNDLLVRAGDAHDPQLGIETIMQYIVEPDGGRVPDHSDIPKDLHAILITGSEWDAHGDDEWIHKLMEFIKCMSFPSQQYIPQPQYVTDRPQTSGPTAPTSASPASALGTRSSAAPSARP